MMKIKIFKIFSDLYLAKKIKEALKYIETNDLELDLRKYEQILENVKTYIKPTVNKITIASQNSVEHIPENLETLVINDTISLETLEKINNLKVKKLFCKGIDISHAKGLELGIETSIESNLAKFKYKNIEGELLDFKTNLKPNNLIYKNSNLDLTLLANYINNPNYNYIDYEFSGGNIIIAKVSSERLSFSISASSNIASIIKFLTDLSKYYKIETLNLEILTEEFSNKPSIKLYEYYEKLRNISERLGLKYVEHNKVARILKESDLLYIDTFVNSLNEITEFYNLIGDNKIVELSIDLYSANKYTEDFDYKSLKKIDRNIMNLNFKYGPNFSMSLKEFISLRNSIMWFRSLIKSSSLSPCEKFLYAYDIMKTFKYKKYQNEQNDFDTLISRAPHLILSPNNDNIVCAGYATILDEIINFIDEGVSSAYSVVTIFDNNDEFLHARNIIRIDDDKYNIHGIFISDSTYDSEVDDDKKRLEALGENYTSLDLYVFFLTALKDYKKVYGTDELPNVLKLLVNKEKLKYDKAKYLKRLFNKDVSEEEIEAYLNTLSIPLDVICEMIKNVRLEEGFTLEEANAEVERIKEMNESEIERITNKR